MITTPTTGVKTTTAPRNQTVSFVGVPSTWVYGDTKALVATATSGLPVTLAASGAGTLADATLGLVIASDVGSCSVTAKQPGDSNWQASPPVSVTVAIGRAAGTIDDFADASFEYGSRESTHPPTATSKTTSPVVYRYVGDNPVGCQLSGATLRMRWNLPGGPSCVIEASVAQDSRYTAATKRATFRLTPIVVFVTSVSYTITGDGSTANVHIIFNRPWILQVQTDCGGHSDFDQLDLLEHDVTISLDQRPCNVTVSPSLYDQYMSVQGKTIEIS